jgi:hypothetical protein
VKLAVTEIILFCSQFFFNHLAILAWKVLSRGIGQSLFLRESSQPAGLYPCGRVSDIRRCRPVIQGGLATCPDLLLTILGYR